jgi:hypothetical protein
LIDAGDCALNGGVGGPYLFAIYCELSHVEIFALAAQAKWLISEKCE